MGRLLVYNVADPFSRGWFGGNSYLANDGRLYIPGGLYGLQVVEVR